MIHDNLPFFIYCFNEKRFLHTISMKGYLSRSTISRVALNKLEEEDGS